MDARNLKTINELGMSVRSEFQVVMKKDEFQLYAKICLGPTKGRKEKMFLSCFINTSLFQGTFTFV